MTETTDSPLYFEKAEVLGSSSFFWKGRGGHSISHIGNKRVRDLIASKQTEYSGLKRSQRGSFAENFARKELHNIRFVIARDMVLSMIPADTAHQQQNNDMALPVAAKKRSMTRHLSDLQLQSLLKKHQSIDQIRSYPPGVFIEIGDGWMLDIIKHLFRDNDPNRIRNLKRPRQETATIHSSTITSRDVPQLHVPELPNSNMNCNNGAIQGYVDALTTPFSSGKAATARLISDDDDDDDDITCINSKVSRSTCESTSETHGSDIRASLSFDATIARTPTEDEIDDALRFCDHEFRYSKQEMSTLIGIQNSCS
ncbi:hypothetical protein ACA910_008365 [Epithemia clementina (nom. ined.)]